MDYITCYPFKFLYIFSQNKKTRQLLLPGKGVLLYKINRNSDLKVSPSDDLAIRHLLILLLPFHLSIKTSFVTYSIYSCISRNNMYWYNVK